MQINRLFEIIYTLLHKKSVTAKELATQFGVSSRTIYRDVDTLSLAGIPVYTEKGKGGGISLLPDFVLNKSILSESEQNAILTALQGLSHVNADEANGALKRLSAIFNKTAANWLEADFSGYSNDFFNDFKTAVLERRIVAFDYFNAEGEKIFRRVEPLQLWFKSKSWYVKGFCLNKQATRLFKLTRVKNLVVTEENFAVRNLLESPDTEDPELPESVIKLRISPEMTYRVYDEFNENDITKQPDGSFIVSATWPEDSWVYGFILSYGEYAEVLEPLHLREIIKEKSQKILRKYL
ncbi:MAG: YafY family transcriptional regulator [Defluviitaleaceae bacterium]|nr:YafY family transcriptional regulator [Defluviitaleaceae bacterium]